MKNSPLAIFREGQVLLDRYFETKENKYREHYEQWVHALYGGAHMHYSQLFGLIRHLNLVSITDIGSSQPY